MKRLILILADAGIELIPPKLWRDPLIVRHSKRRGKHPSQILLDISLHYSSMKKLREWWKRGRPDILHLSLLVATSSLLFKLGLMEILIHTYKGRVFHLSQGVRLPRNYERFKGLIEQLLKEGRVPPKHGAPLIYEVKSRLPEVVEQLNIDTIYLLDEKGIIMPPKTWANNVVKREKPAVIIGCFQRGAFGKEVSSLHADKISFAPITFDAWYVTAKAVSVIEDALSLFSMRVI